MNDCPLCNGTGRYTPPAERRGALTIDRIHAAVLRLGLGVVSAETPEATLRAVAEDAGYRPELGWQNRRLRMLTVINTDATSTRPRFRRRPAASARLRWEYVPLPPPTA